MKKQKILIVEDYRDFQGALRTQLENDGFEVIVADDGYQGYERTKQEKPDLIILDVMIPVMDGFHVSKLLKNDIHLKNIPIIMMSGTKKDKEDKEKGINACDADAYLLKPFEHQELLNTINQLLTKKETNHGR